MLIPVSLPQPGQRRQQAAWTGSADALALAELAQLKRPLIILAEHATDARRLLDEIRWFSPQLNVQFLPDWETLPYDQFSPHQDLISERLATLYLISAGQCDVVIVPLSSAMGRLLKPCASNWCQQATKR
jgi:transcription-repair coupling factor (superfamily II helicase)